MLPAVGLPAPRHWKPTRRTLTVLTVAGYVLLGVVLAAAAHWAVYLPVRTTFDVHTILESIAATLALSVGALGLVRYYSGRESMFLYVGVGFITSGALDVIHILTLTQPLAAAFPSMGAHIGPWGWWASRTYLATMLLTATISWHREARAVASPAPEAVTYLLSATFVLAVFGVLLSVRLPPYPPVLEVAPAILFSVAFAGFLVATINAHEPLLRWLAMACFLSAATQVFFTPFATSHLGSVATAGHLLKITTTLLLLGGILVSVYHLQHETVRRQMDLTDANQRLAAEVDLRRRAQLEAQNGRLLIQSVFDSMSEGAIFAKSVDEEVLFNRAARDLLGIEVAGMPLREWDAQMSSFHPDGTRLPFEEQPIIRALRGEAVDQQEVVLRPAGGRDERLLTVSARPLSGGNGAVAVLRDVTAERRTLHALAAERERYRSVVRSASDAIVVADSTGRIVEFNPAAEAMFGHRSEDIVGLPTTTLVPEDVREIHAETLRQYIQHRTGLTIGRSIEIRGRHADGTEFPVELNISTWEIAGRPFFTAVIRDISERQAAARALAAERERYRSVVHTASDAIVVADQDGTIVEFNPAAELMFGHHAPDIIGRHTAVLVPERLRAAHLAGIRRYNETGEGGLVGRGAVELAALHADGTEFPVELSLSAWRGEERVFFTAVARDISERQAAALAIEERGRLLRARNQELQEFAFVASHDLREPLRKIIAFGQRIDEDMGESMPTPSRDHLQRMRQAAVRMQRLIDDLLAYSRVTTQTRPFVATDLNDTAAAVVSDLEPRITEQRGAVDLGPLPVVDADPVQMHQLLQNLIGNALKYHRPGVPPLVTVRGTVEDDEAVVTVQDNGIGIDMKYAEQIFRPFQRLHGVGEYEGTGMGLAIVRKIVERHHGSIALDSEPGRGSRFTVHLPLQQPEGTETLTSEPIAGRA